MSKEVNLNSILGDPNVFNSPAYGRETVLLAMKQACEEVVRLAAENAKLYFIDLEQTELDIDKESILNTINQVKWK